MPTQKFKYLFKKLLQNFASFKFTRFASTLIKNSYQIYLSCQLLQETKTPKLHILPIRRHFIIHNNQLIIVIVSTCRLSWKPADSHRSSFHVSCCQQFIHTERNYYCFNSLKTLWNINTHRTLSMLWFNILIFSSKLLKALWSSSKLFKALQSSSKLVKACQSLSKLV